MTAPNLTRAAARVVKLRTSEAVTIPRRSYYWGETTKVAKRLLGSYLVVVKGGGRRTPQLVGGRIVEVEAYLGETDPACHASRGMTPRTEVFYRSGGIAYVFCAYGIHRCFNVITRPEGESGCVLVRALEPMFGLEQMARNRGVEIEKVSLLCSGPGRLTQALGIGMQHNGAAITAAPLIVLLARPTDHLRVGVGPRVGISEAREWPLRFTLRDSPWLSAPA